jgi:hypothetical protein
MYTKLEILAFSCRVTWGWSARVNLCSRLILILRRNIHLTIIGHRAPLRTAGPTSSTMLPVWESLQLSEYVNGIHNIKVHGFSPNEMQRWRSIRFKVGSAKMPVAHSFSYMSPACWCHSLVKVLRAFGWTRPNSKGEWLVTVRQSAVTVYRVKYQN